MKVPPRLNKGASQYSRRLPDGHWVVAARRPEDLLWHAEETRRDGVVVDWAYAPTLEGALDELGLGPGGKGRRTLVEQTQAEASGVVEIGNDLREARRRLELTLHQVQAATAIPERHLDALELERFELLPKGLYRRSFLRTYAEFLGLDSATYTAEYERRFPAPPSDAPKRNHRLPHGQGKAGAFLTPARATLAAVLVLAAVGVWQLGNPGTPRQATPPVTQAKTSVTGRAAQPSSHPRPRRPRTSAASSRPTLRLIAASGRCWLRVQVGSSSGPVVYEQTLEQGQSLRFGLGKPLWIRVGAPSALEAFIGQRQVTDTLPPNTSELRVSASGITTAAP